MPRDPTQNKKPPAGGLIPAGERLVQTFQKSHRPLKPKEFHHGKYAKILRRASP